MEYRNNQFQQNDKRNDVMQALFLMYMYAMSWCTCWNNPQHMINCSTVWSYSSTEQRELWFMPKVTAVAISPLWLDQNCNLLILTTTRVVQFPHLPVYTTPPPSLLFDSAAMSSAIPADFWDLLAPVVDEACWLGLALMPRSPADYVWGCFLLMPRPILGHHKKQKPSSKKHLYHCTKKWDAFYFFFSAWSPAKPSVQAYIVSNESKGLQNHLRQQCSRGLRVQRSRGRYGWDWIGVTASFWSMASSPRVVQIRICLLPYKAGCIMTKKGREGRRYVSGKVGGSTLIYWGSMLSLELLGLDWVFA